MTIIKIATVMVAASLCCGCGANEFPVEKPQDKTLALLLSQEDDFPTDLKECIEAENQGTEIRYLVFQGVSGLENTNE